MILTNDTCRVIHHSGRIARVLSEKDGRVQVQFPDSAEIRTFLANRVTFGDIDRVQWNALVWNAKKMAEVAALRTIDRALDLRHNGLFGKK